MKAATSETGLIEHAPDAIIFADRTGVIRVWNHRAEALFGHSAEEAVGQTLDLIVVEPAAQLGPFRSDAFESRALTAGDWARSPSDALVSRRSMNASCVWSLPMPLLFAYGTLQQENVQRSTFGRLLQGQEDELPGFEHSLVRIEDPHAVATSGQTHYSNVTFNGRSDSRVRGTVFEITDAELAAADQYEQVAAYTRVAAMLASGKQAWVYVNARSAPGAA